MINQEKKLYVTVPKGVNRFAIQGSGANYVHGGAMLQEIVVPVIHFKNDRSKSTENKIKTVDVKLTSVSRKITSTIIYLEFFQVGRIEQKVIALYLNAYFVDEDGERISNVIKIIADSQANEAVNRVLKEKFVFRSINYDNRKTYYLVLENDSTQEVYKRYPFSVDIPTLYE